MSLIKSKQKPVYKWHPGDVIGATEAAQLLGYETPRNLQGKRLDDLKMEFASAGCSFTTDIWIGGRRRFLRSEIDLFLTKKVEKVREIENKRRRDLRLAA